MSEKSERCQSCGASMKMYWHTIKPNMVRSLVKVLTAVNVKSRAMGGVKLKVANDVRIDRLPENIALTHEERCNFQKLRLHGLVARVRIEGKVKRGRWLITKKGYDFLKGGKVPHKVKSFRNKVVEHSVNWVNITDVMRDQENYESIDTIQFDIFEKGE